MIPQWLWLWKKKRSPSQSPQPQSNMNKCGVWYWFEVFLLWKWCWKLLYPQMYDFFAHGNTSFRIHTKPALTLFRLFTLYLFSLLFFSLFREFFSLIFRLYTAFVHHLASFFRAATNIIYLKKKERTKSKSRYRKLLLATKYTFQRLWFSHFGSIDRDHFTEYRTCMYGLFRSVRA